MRAGTATGKSFMNSINITKINSAGVSVVICCYNSAARLGQTLEHLARQAMPESLPWEVLVVVDKASPDDTDVVAVRTWREAGAPAPLKVIIEEKPGKSPALTNGFTNARHDIIVVVDDDNWLNSDYLARAFLLMRQHPETGILGGKITGAFEVEPPGWFQHFQAAYAVGAQGKVSGDITEHKRHVAGAGMVVRKSAYELIKQRGFRPVLTGGRRGNLTAGEDLELCYAVVLAGYRIWYDENLCLTHFMPKDRITIESLLEMNRRNRIAGPLQAGYEIALRGTDASPLKFYLHRVLLLGSWLLKSALKFLLQRESWLALRIAFSDWTQSLFDYAELRRVFRLHYPEILKLKPGNASK